MTLKRNSMRAHLLALAQQHPDWANKQYARELGQTVDTIRAALLVLRKKGYLGPKPSKVKKQKRKVEEEERKPTPVVHVQPGMTGSGRQTFSGYIRLF